MVNENDEQKIRQFLMRLLLTEADDFLRESWQTALQAKGYLVDGAKDGQASFNHCIKSSYDLVILDSTVPKLTGIQVCRQLRAKGQTVPILLLTTNDDEDKIAGLEAGADDYLVKPFTIPELLARIRAFLQPGSPSALSSLTWGDLKLDPRTAQVTYRDQLVSLSPKEYRLLALLMRYPQRIFSKAAIFEHLWSLADLSSAEIVRAQIQGLRRKLKQVGIDEIIETTYGVGYRLKAEPIRVTPDPPNTRKTLAAVARVWEQDQEQLLSRLDTLQSAITALQQRNLLPPLRQAAIDAAHKLAEFLGMYGITSGSAVAQNIKQQLEKLEDLPQNLTPIFLNIQLSRLQQLLNKASEISVTPSFGQVLWLVSENPALINRLQATAAHWYFQLLVRDFATAQGAEPPFPQPALILLEFSTPRQRSLRLLEHFTSRLPHIPVLVLVPPEQLQEGSAVTPLDGKSFLPRETPPARIFETITDLLQPHPEAKVLAVDDDSLILEILYRYLSPWGIALYTLQDASQFQPTLARIRPDLLILAVKMPNVNGIELCQIVRNHRAWRKLPILFLSVRQDSQTLQRIFAAGADDYISKPVTEPELITRIFGQLERIRLLKKQQNYDSLTGLFNRPWGQSTLNRSLEQAQEQAQSLCLMVIQLEHLETINFQYGYEIGDRVLQRFGQLLFQVFQTSDTIARWSGAQFLVWRLDCTQEQGQRYLEQLQQLVAPEVFLGTGVLPLSISFQAGLAVYPDAGQDFQKLYRVAATRLSEGVGQRETN